MRSIKKGQEWVMVDSGLRTKHWGPHFWKTMYYTALNYPVKITKSDCHQKIKKHTIAFYAAMQYTLPCVFCLESYRRFYKELDIEQYSGSRIDMLEWVYLMKDMVNKKLIAQEKTTLDAAISKIKQMHADKKITRSYMNSAIKAAEKRILVTKSSPSFSEFLDSLKEVKVL